MQRLWLYAPLGDFPAEDGRATNVLDYRCWRFFAVEVHSRMKCSVKVSINSWSVFFFFKYYFAKVC